jgi:hypothetical protein
MRQNSPPHTRCFSSFCGLSFQDLQFQYKTCTFSIVLLCCTNRLFILLLGLLASINVFMISTVLLTEKRTTYISKSQKTRTIFHLCQHGWIEHWSSHLKINFDLTNGFRARVMGSSCRRVEIRNCWGATVLYWSRWQLLEYVL